MTQDTRALLVCEKLLNNVKASNLNYLLNETPYSAFITIRKRFTKDYHDLPNVTLAQNDGKSVEEYQKENNLLKVKCKSIETEMDSFKKQNSELKKNLSAYMDENISLNQKLFILKGELAIQEESFSKEQENSHKMLKEKQSLQDQLKESKKKLENVNDLMREKDDTIEMLNINIENKKSELTTLKKEIIELGVDSCSSSFKCEQCDFTTESEKGLKIHVGRMHEVK